MNKIEKSFEEANKQKRRDEFDRQYREHEQLSKVLFQWLVVVAALFTIYWLMP